jgi:hypothetical protein
MSAFRSGGSFGPSLAILMAVLVGSACAATPETKALSSPSSSADETFTKLLSSIEGHRSDLFMSSVDPFCVPSSSMIWSDLNEFLRRAYLIEYNVTVEQRVVRDDGSIGYFFRWERKHRDRDDGATIDAAGRSEWVLSRRAGQPYMLVLATGDPVFAAR